MIVTPYIDSPATRSLVSILNEVVDQVFIMGTLRQAFVLRDIKREKTLFSLPLTRRYLPNILISHVYSMLYTISLVINNRMDLILFSQTIDYPLHVMILAKILKIPTLDFIGGSRHYLLNWNMRLSRKWKEKLFSAYGLASLNVAVRLVDRIVLLSKHLVDEHPFTRLHSKLSFAWNFPSSDFYSRFKVEKRYDEREPIVGFVGKLSVLKGALHLIKAIPLVTKQIPDVKFVLIGSPTEQIAKAIEELLRSHKTCVKHFHSVPHNHMPHHYNNMMLLVHPSYSEGGPPHVVLEALACGTPVLIARVGAFAEIIEKNALGFILNNRTPEALATQIISLLDKRDLLSKVSEHSVVWLRENITHKQAVSMWRKILEETASGAF